MNADVTLVVPDFGFESQEDLAALVERFNRLTREQINALHKVMRLRKELEEAEKEAREILREEPAS